MKAFISYSHRDNATLERLHAHLAVLLREGPLTAWYDRDILAGGSIDAEIADNLNDSQLFLPLVSADFLNSDYCYEEEMARAIELHEAGEIRIVPIIVHPCDWKSTPLVEFKALPKDANPISEWTSQDNAFLDIVTELRRVIQSSSAEQAEQSANAQDHSSPTSTTRYRIKRDFDEVDIGECRKRPSV